MDLAILKKSLLANKWSRYFSAIVGGAISAITVFMALAFALFALTGILLGWTGKPGMEFWVIFGTAFLCGIVGGFTVLLAIAKEGRCRSFFQWWTKLRFFRWLFWLAIARWLFRLAIACAFWAFFIIVLLEKQDSRTPWPAFVALLWINLPIGFTVFRSFRRTSREWDWCFITLICLYAEIVAYLLISGTWLPDIHYLRGLLFGFGFVAAVLAIGFIQRLMKRKMSMPMFVYYLLGLAATGATHFVTQLQWTL